jgi:hypothetical protein
MKTHFTISLLVAVLCLGSIAARAELPNFNQADPDKGKGFFPLQIALATPLQIVPETWDITGFRLNLIYGTNTNVSFLDFGLLNRTKAQETGIMVGGVWNGVEGGVSGVQVAGLLNNSGSAYMMEGLQVSCLNISGDVVGLQVGAFNNAKSVQGMQIGVFNYAEQLNGMQIGLININNGAGIPFMPVLNVGF